MKEHDQPHERLPGHRRAWRRALLALECLLALLMLALAAPAWADGARMQPASDAQLRATAARGFPDSLFAHRNLVLSHGNAAEILGDAALLLNLPLALLDGGTPFRWGFLNPADLSTVIDDRGMAYVRVDTHIAYYDTGPLRLDGRGPSFGRVEFRDIDLRGTTMRIGRQR